MQQTELSPQERMIQRQIIERGVRDIRVIDAMRAVPRERFFPQKLREEAYHDQPAPIGHGQTISQPYIVALMTECLRVQPGHRVLEIGTGSGYQTAILAHLSAEVYSIERIKPLLDEAFERLMELGISNVHLKWADGMAGWPQAAPFDRILIGAGAPSIPDNLLRTHLADGGIAVLPVGPEDEQMLVYVRRRGDELVRTDVSPCRFVKLIGAGAWGD